MATAIDDMVDEAVDAAVAAWSDDGYLSYDDTEVNCTVQLYRRLEDAILRTPRLRVLSPRLEWVQPTPAMYAAEESAKAALRPDIRLWVGTETGLTLECKRLSLDNRHPERYVTEGMLRFVRGRYGPNEATGAMVGYVQIDEPGDIVGAVNDVVDGHAEMGASHRLSTSARTLSAIPFLYESAHARDGGRSIELTHYVMDLRTRRANKSTQS